MSDLDAIKEIEKIIGRKLMSCPANKDIMWWKQQGHYLLNNNQVIGLNLHGFRLKNIDFLSLLPNLILFNLGDNQINNIEPLTTLTNLTLFNLRFNKITNIESLANLTKLTSFELSVNHIKDIKPLANLTKLTSFELSGNQISDIEPLANLTKLTWFDLSNNQITDIKPLVNLTNLTSFNLNYNQIRDIEPLVDLTNLTSFDLSNNQITDIRPLFNLTNLTAFDLSNNKLIAIPEWLLNFNLEINLNDSFANNPIEQPPLEIIWQGSEAIRAYFEQLKKDREDYIYEAKLILVGEGGSGKTSLANKIIDPKWQLIPENESQSTQGIDILRYSFPYKGKIFKVNIWDFGGQEIYHQTHQFFLSKRALYFLLADNRKEDSDFYYWINTVSLLSDNSPLLIIKNEKQDRPRQIPESPLKAEFSNIKDILATNLKNNRGLDAIIASLHYHLSQLSHIGSALPKSWINVRHALEQNPAYTLDIKDYFKLCQQHGFENEKDKLQLSQYLHDLGVCLHFQDDDLLQRTLILKPTWATDAVYKVLDNRAIIQNFGCFNKNDLSSIWQEVQYCDFRAELLDLMKKFKLCYEIPNKKQHYISPQLLENKAPVYYWQSANNLLLRYQYDFMLKGIISQLIVIMHEYIANNYQWVWKSGVVLEKQGARAEIIEYYGKREIHIRVSGYYKKELLNNIRHELDKINNSYERLKDKCKKLIPCNCRRCSNSTEPYFYDYAKLKERINHRKYTIECGKPPYNEVDILKLVEDISIDKQASPQGAINTININTGDNNVSGDTRNTTAGVYVEGNVNGGTIAARDVNITNNQGVTKDELLQLLQSFKQELKTSNLSSDTFEVVCDDIESVERQLQKEQPSQLIVSDKLNRVNGLIENANSAMDTVENASNSVGRLLDLSAKIIKTAVLLFA
ncbi:MAG: COR domain-containing protein [Methylococcaceae bacterium]